MEERAEGWSEASYGHVWKWHTTSPLYSIGRTWSHGPDFSTKEPGKCSVPVCSEEERELVRTYQLFP